MVGVGMLMLVVAWGMALLLWRRRRTQAALPRFALYILAGMTFSGWVATLAGWWVTEIGRQPFIVYGLLRTADTVAEHPVPLVMGTLIAWLALYVVLLVSYIGVIRYMAEHPKQPAPEAPLPIATTGA